MIQLNPYLSFEGNSFEALEFYKQCLGGGEISVMRISETSIKAHFPPEMQDKLAHGMLKHGRLVLMASDMVWPEGLAAGNDMTVIVQADSKEETAAVYQRFAQDARKITCQLSDSFWGGYYGSVIDKYGKHWAFNYEPNLP